MASIVLFHRNNEVSVKENMTKSEFDSIKKEIVEKKKQKEIAQSKKDIIHLIWFEENEFEYGC
jgi:hypothetical protein